MNLFSCDSYKEVLRSALEARKTGRSGDRFTYQAMAAHCGVQKTYLSKILNRDGHLNDDQLFMALDYLELNDTEREFTLLLAAWEKSLVPARKQVLAARIHDIRAMQARTEAKLPLELHHARTSDLTEYYLDPYFQIIHMFLTIRRYRLEPDLVCRSLALKPVLFSNYMMGLERMGIIRLQESNGVFTKVQVVLDNIHLPRESFLHSAYATRLRLKSMDRMDQLGKDESYRFSVIFSTNARTRDKIHSSFLEWLKGVQQSVQSGKEEDVYQINFDLLPWS